LRLSAVLFSTLTVNVGFRSFAQHNSCELEKDECHEMQIVKRNNSRRLMTHTPEAPEVIDLTLTAASICILISWICAIITFVRMMRHGRFHPHQIFIRHDNQRMAHHCRWHYVQGTACLPARVVTSISHFAAARGGPFHSALSAMCAITGSSFIIGGVRWGQTDCATWTSVGFLAASGCFLIVVGFVEASESVSWRSSLHMAAAMGYLACVYVALSIDGIGEEQFRGVHFVVIAVSFFCFLLFSVMSWLTGQYTVGRMQPASPPERWKLQVDMEALESGPPGMPDSYLEWRRKRQMRRRALLSHLFVWTEFIAFSIPLASVILLFTRCAGFEYPSRLHTFG
jgi:hypothetical protein